MTQKDNKGFLLLHLSVFIAGFTGVLGRLIELDSAVLVWHRMAFMVVVCTNGLCLLQIIVLQKIDAFTVNLTYNLEPVYSIIIAMIIFNEYQELNFSFILGIALIIISVVLQTWSKLKVKS